METYHETFSGLRPGISWRVVSLHDLRPFSGEGGVNLWITLPGGLRNFTDVCLKYVSVLWFYALVHRLYLASS